MLEIGLICVCFPGLFGENHLGEEVEKWESESKKAKEEEEEREVRTAREKNVKKRSLEI